MMIGPTGDFPQGRLRDDDQGGLQIAVGSLGGKVVIQFGTPVEWAGMDPDTAEQLGHNLIRRAGEIMSAKPEAQS